MSAIPGETMAAMALPATTASPAANPQRIDAVTVNDGESLGSSSTSDGIHAYFGTLTGLSPGRVVKIRLADNRRIASLQFGVGETDVVAAVNDGTYGYFVTGTVPAKVIKVRLSNMSRVGSQTLFGSDGTVTSAVLDDTGTHALFGTDSSPGKVIRMRLADLVRLEAIELNAGEGDLATVITYAGSAFFGARQTGGPSRVIEVQMSPLARVGALTLNAGEVGVESAVASGIYGYFGTFTSPGRVVKVRLTDLARVGSTSFGEGEGGAGAGMSDGTHVYFGTVDGPASTIVKLRESDLARVGSVTLQPGEVAPTSSARRAGLGYFGLFLDPGKVVRIATVIGVGDSCGFADQNEIPGWARVGACWLKEARVTQNNPFRPSDRVTRAEMVTFLWRFAGQPQARSSCGFIDGVTSIPLYARIGACWAQATGTTTSDPFRAADLVSRAEVAAFLWRVSGSPPSASSCGLSDEAQIPAWARPGVCFLTTRGVTVSNPYRPGEVLSRAEMATFLTRLYSHN